MLYLNNALSSTMLMDGEYKIRSLQDEEVVLYLNDAISRSEFVHAGNPSHKPTWDAVAKRLQIPAIAEPKGGKIALKAGDRLLVAEVSGLPRETREFTEAEIKAATIRFRLMEPRIEAPLRYRVE